MADFFVNLSSTSGGFGTASNPWGVNAIDRTFGFGLQISDAGLNNRAIKAGDRVFCTGTLNRWQGLQLMGVGGNGTDFDKIDACLIEDLNLNNYIQIIGDGALVNGANWGIIKVGSDGTRGSKFLRVSGFEVIYDESFKTGSLNCGAVTHFANGNNNVDNSDGIVVSGFNNSPVHHIILDDNHCHDLPFGSGINVTLDFNGTTQDQSWDYVRIEGNRCHDAGKWDYRGPQGITALKGTNLAGTPNTDTKLYVVRNECWNIVQAVNSKAIGLDFVSDGHGFLFGPFNNGKAGVMVFDYNIAYDTGAAGMGWIEGGNTRHKIRNNTTSNTGWYVNGFSGTIQGQRLSACNCAWNGSYTSLGSCYTDEGGISITAWNTNTTAIEVCNNLVLQPNVNLQKGYKAAGNSGPSISGVSDNWVFGASSNDIALEGTSNPLLGTANGGSGPWCPAPNSPLVDAGHVPSAPTPCVDFFGNPISGIPDIGACERSILAQCSITQTIGPTCANSEWGYNLLAFGGVGPFTLDQSQFWHGDLVGDVWVGADSGPPGTGTKFMTVIDGNGASCYIEFDVVSCPTSFPGQLATFTS